MAWLPIAIMFWIALGIVVVVGVELAERSHGRTGPLAQGTFLSSLAFSAALVVGAPLFLLYGLAVALGTLWRGNLPITGKPWWPARAAKFEKALESNSRSEPTSVVELTPNNLAPNLREKLLEISELYFLLRSDGLSESQTIRRIITSRSDRVGDLIADGELTLRGYLAALAQRPSHHFRRRYVLADETLAWLVRHGNEMARGLQEWPPPQWLQAPADFALLGTMPDSRFVSRVKLRRMPGDELWTFSSPPESWQAMAGRGGFALVRGGRAIDHTLTVLS